MKKLLLCFTFSLSKLCGMTSQEMSPEHKLAMVLTCLEKKKHINATTHKVILNYPGHIKNLLSEITTEDLNTLYALDLKERCGSILNPEKKHIFDTSRARLLTMQPLRTFESISRTLKWLKKNSQILPSTAKFLTTPEHFSDFYEALSPEQIHCFLIHYECVQAPQSKPETYADLTKKVIAFIRSYITQQRKLKPSPLLLPKPKPILDDEKLERELENIHLRTPSFETSPRTDSPSPEPEQETESSIHKPSTPQSPAIDIKTNFQKLKPETPVKIIYSEGSCDDE